MSDRILSIDIQSDLLTAVVLEVDGKLPVIEQAIVELADSRPSEEVFSQLVRKIVEIFKYDCEVCHVSFGADLFFYRNLTLPFTDRKTVNRVLPFELEGTVSGESDQLVIDSLTSKGDDGEGKILAALLPKDFLTSRLVTLQEGGIDPETVTISGLATAGRILGLPDRVSDFLVLNVGLQRASLIRVQSGNTRLIRSLVFDPGLEVGYQLDSEKKYAVPLRPKNVDHAIKSFCLELKQTLQAIGYSENSLIYLTGVHGNAAEMAVRIESSIGLSCLVVEREKLLPVIEPGAQAANLWSSAVFANAVDLAWLASKGWRSLDFRKGEFARESSFVKKRFLLKVSAVLLFFVMAGYLGYLMQDYNRLKQEKKILAEQIKIVFTETLPDVTRIVDPVQQLQVKVNELESTGVEKGGGSTQYTVLDILAEISRFIPKAFDVELERMIIDAKGVRLKGLTDNFNTVDAIKKVLDQSLLFSEVIINSANLDQKSSKIKFEMKLEIGE